MREERKGEKERKERRKERERGEGGEAEKQEVDKTSYCHYQVSSKMLIWQGNAPSTGSNHSSI
jgi:hypothetical protein